MTAQRAKKAQAILDRLSTLEQSQHDMMDRLQTAHQRQMAELRSQLEEAQLKCSDADEGQLVDAPPLLVHVNMTAVEAAVHAASFAEQESAEALAEARQVAEEARAAAGALVPVPTAAPPVDPHIPYAPDAEFIVKKVSVNLDDVERAINNSSYVSVCRAFGLPDSKYGNEVYCAVVPKKKVKVSEPMLFIHAQKYLPTAMVPKRFYFLPDLPSGITRKALADTQMSGDLGNPSLSPAEPPSLPALQN